MAWHARCPVRELRNPSSPQTGACVDAAPAVFLCVHSLEALFADPQHDLSLILESECAGLGGRVL